MEYAFLKSLLGDISGCYQINDYIDIEPERTDSNLIAGLGLTYQVSQWVSSRIDYRFRLLDSTDEFRGFNENRISFNITVSPPRPYRIFP